MSIHYARAKDGYKFRITFYGRRISSIASKYNDSINSRKQYEKTVPKVWLTRGYVEEVREDEP